MLINRLLNGPSKVGSVVFDVLESVRGFDSFGQSVPVLDMAAVVADSGVEDITQRVLSQEQVAEQPHTLGILVIDPHTSEIGNGVDNFFFFLEFCNKLIVGDVFLF